MHPLQFIFRFLYTRNWESGKLELSRPRVALFAGMLVIVVLGLILAIVLSLPVEYVSAYSHV